jgi:hypothetical protein
VLIEKLQELFIENFTSQWHIQTIICATYIITAWKLSYLLRIVQYHIVCYEVQKIIFVSSFSYPLDTDDKVKATYRLFCMVTKFEIVPKTITLIKV